MKNTCLSPNISENGHSESSRNNRMSFSPFSVRNYDEVLVTGARVLVQYQQQEHIGKVMQSMPELNMFCVEIESPHRGGHIMVTRGIEELKIHSDKPLEDELYMEEVYGSNPSHCNAIKTHHCTERMENESNMDDSSSYIDVDTCETDGQDDLSQDMELDEEYNSMNEVIEKSPETKKDHQSVILNRLINMKEAENDANRKFIINSPNGQEDSVSSGYLTRTGSHLTSLSPPISAGLPQDSFVEIERDNNDEDLEYEENLCESSGAGSDSHPLTNSASHPVNHHKNVARDYGMFSFFNNGKLNGALNSICQSYPSVAGSFSVGSNVSSPDNFYPSPGPLMSNARTCFLYICSLCSFRTPQEDKMIYHLLELHSKEISNVIQSYEESKELFSMGESAPDNNNILPSSLGGLSRFYQQHELSVERLTEMLAAELITNGDPSLINARSSQQHGEQNGKKLNGKSISPGVYYHPELHDNLGPLGVIPGRSISSSISLSGNRLRRFSDNQLEFDETSESSVTQSSPIKIPGRQTQDIEHNAPMKKARTLSLNNPHTCTQHNALLHPIFSNSPNASQMTHFATSVGSRVGIDRSKSTSWLPGLTPVNRLSAASPVSASPIGNSFSVFQINATSPLSKTFATHFHSTNQSATTAGGGINFSIGQSKPTARSDWLQPDLPGFSHNTRVFSSPHSLSPNHMSCQQASYPGGYLSVSQQNSLLSPNSKSNHQTLSQSSNNSNTTLRRVRSDVKKCRKVYGVDQRDRWCNQCKWKKACRRFPDPDPMS